MFPKANLNNLYNTDTSTACGTDSPTKICLCPIFGNKDENEDHTMNCSVAIESNTRKFSLSAMPFTATKSGHKKNSYLNGQDTFNNQEPHEIRNADIRSNRLMPFFIGAIVIFLESVESISLLFRRKNSLIKQRPKLDLAFPK